MLSVRIAAVKFGLFRALHLSQHVVCKALNRIEVFAAQSGVVRDVEASTVHGFVGSRLENVGSKDTTCCAADDVHGRVVIHQLLAPSCIEETLHQIADLHRSIDKMEHMVTLLLRVEHASVRGLSGQSPLIALLATAFRVEAGLVQNDGVRCAFCRFTKQRLAGEDAGLHLREVDVIIEQQRGFREFWEVFHQGSVLG